MGTFETSQIHKGRLLRDLETLVTLVDNSWLGMVVNERQFIWDGGDLGESGLMDIHSIFSGPAIT